MPWPVLTMTAWAFAMATMHTTETRKQWWGLVLCLRREVYLEQEAQDGAMEVWCWEEQVLDRAGVQISFNTVTGLQEENNGVALSFQVPDTG